MSELYNKIEILCKSHNISITSMCKSADVSRSSLTDLKSGRSKELSTLALTKIAKFFNKSIDYFVIEERENDSKKIAPFSNDEEWNEHISMFKSLSPSDRDLVLGVMKGLASKNGSDK